MFERCMRYLSDLHAISVLFVHHYLPCARARVCVCAGARLRLSAKR